MAGITGDQTLTSSQVSGLLSLAAPTALAASANVSACPKPYTLNLT